MTASPDSIVEESIEHLAELHREHDDATTAPQRFANRITALVSRPVFVIAVLIFICGWTLGNMVAARLGLHPIEAPPFPETASIASIAGLIVVLLILSTQQHEEALSKKRAQLTLQIAVLSERKIAKIIALLEEQRRDNPMLETRVDHEAVEMAQSSDPRASLAELEARLPTS